MTKRLTPMFEDPSESARLRELLEAGRNAQVTDYDFEQGLRKHLSQIEAGVPAPQWAQSFGVGGSAATGAAGMLTNSLWLWVGVPFVTVSAIAALWLTQGREPAPTAERAKVAMAPVEVPAVEAAPSPTAAGIGSAERTAEPARGERAPSQAQSASEARREPQRARRSAERHVAKHAANARTAVATRDAVDAPSLSTTSAARAVESARRSEPVAVATTAKTAKTTPSAARTQVELAAAVEPEAPEEPVVAAAQPERPAAPQLDDARLEREMGMLAMTQRVLFSDPERALKLARQGESEFEGSMFTQERQQLLLLALVKLGRIDEAKRLARPYLARYPNGPFSDRVRRSLASGRVDR